MRADMDKNIYYGYIVKGDLHGAIRYIRQFPEQRDLYHRFMAVFEQEQYITYPVDTSLNALLRAYQQYYRDVFYLCMNKKQAADTLGDRLKALCGLPDADIDLCELEQKELAPIFRHHGLHFLGGQTGGYYGPYTWQTSETVSFKVALPDGIQTYAVKLLDGFITRSWIDYVSFGELGPGGWADCDGTIHCIRSSWDFQSESFRVSLLKHEAQHARDFQSGKDMSSEELEYRAKLVELMYARERNLLKEFTQEADPIDQANSHARAAYRIMKGFSEILGTDTVDPSRLSIEQIQTIAAALFEESQRKQ